MADPTDFDDAPETVLDAPIPEAILAGDTSPSRASSEWRAGREVGRAEGLQLALDALREELVVAGVPPAEVPDIVERVRGRAEAIAGA